MDPSPFTLRQIVALVCVGARELGWVVPNVTREIAFWRRRARAIVDPGLREDALTTLRRERLDTEGAALFATLPRRRDRRLLSLLVMLQLILDYVDTVSERAMRESRPAGRQLQLALIDAVDLGRPMSDYFRYHERRHGDGGYLSSLVSRCRRGCAQMPGYRVIAPGLIEHAQRFEVQAINHDPVPDRRNVALSVWAKRQFGSTWGLRPFELTAAASSTLAMHALLALASEGSIGAEHVERVNQTYFPWVNAASTLLDSYVDQADDLATGNHRYVAHYRDPVEATEALRHLVSESVWRARALPRGTRHTLIVSGMVAMYLSHDAAWSPELREASREISRAAGSLQRVQLPILRAMRAIHGLRAA